MFYARSLGLNKDFGVVEPADIPFRDLDELEGATLAGRFVLEHLIGRGGYGAVFIGEQTSVGRKCAVKVLVPHVLEKEVNVKRFEREAKMTSALAHPNTVVIYDFGLDEERRLLYLVMEHIQGESLRDRIERERQMDLETVVWIAHQAAGSLQDAHEAGMVHRDVKPHNIMLTNRGGDADFVKVIDFGIAKFLDDDSIRETFRRVTQTGMVIGTPAYMPPEQVRSQELDGRADQYALAACVYQMLTGARLFSGESPIDIATKQLTQRPRPASERNAAVPAEVDRVLMRALAKNREQRYPTITEFTVALAEAAGVPLRAVDSAERDRVALAETLEANVEVDEEPTTRPIGAQAKTKSAEVRPVPGMPLARNESAAPRTTALGLPLLIMLGAVCVVLAGLALRGDDEPAATRPPPSEPVAVQKSAAPQPMSEAPTIDPPDLGATEELTPTADAERTPEPAPKKPKKSEPVPDSKSDANSTPAPRDAPKPQTAKITVVAAPWGEIVIDGKARSEKRRETFKLTAGKHIIELHQSGVRVDRKTVDVQPGKNRMVKLNAAP